MAISAGDYHSLALKSDGTVVAWGDNSDGQRTVPAGLSGVVAISAGNYNSLALKSDGTVVAWGSNGQNTPAGLSAVLAISAGFGHNLALQTPPALPATVSASDNDSLRAGKVHVTWSSVNGANYYRVFRAASATDPKAAVSGWQSDTVFDDTTATGGSLYYYCVVAARDASGACASAYSTYDVGQAALTASEVFSNWMTAHKVNGVPPDAFLADRDADGVYNGLEFAFGANRSPSEPLILLTATNGNFRVGLLKQTDETVPYVDMAIRCSTDLQDWNYPLTPMTDSTGLPTNRNWFVPGGAPNRLFLRLEASLKQSP